MGGPRWYGPNGAGLPDHPRGCHSNRLSRVSLDLPHVQRLHNCSAERTDQRMLPLGQILLYKTRISEIEGHQKGHRVGVTSEQIDSLSQWLGRRLIGLGHSAQNQSLALFPAIRSFCISKI